MENPKLCIHTLMNWIEVFMRRSMRHFLLYAKQNGLSMAQAAALFLINRKSSCSVSEIGGELEITNPAASQLLDRLVQQGFVVRSEDPKDRRLKKISLSDQGEVLLQQWFRSRHQWLEDLVKRMSPDEQGHVLEGLKIMLEKARQLENQPPPGS